MGNIINIETIGIKSLKKYKNNSKKHSEKQIKMIQNSIKEFGFLSPCLIDEENNVIAGHGRIEAAAGLGIESVPCLRIEGLTEDQRRAYIIADNRLTELGSWDKELLATEISELDINDFDIDLTGFSIGDIEELNLDTPQIYGEERKRTANAYNMGLVEQDTIQGDFWQMPIITNDNYVPEKLIGFNYAKTSEDKKVGIHFYLDDYQFERIWANPEKYVDVLAQYDCILSPDFSLYLNMPMPMKIWNTYRSRFIGAYYQSKGIKVIPTISWAEKETFSFCFEGIPENSIVSVSTIGVKENADALDVWVEGMEKMIEKIKPSKILVYGGQLDFNYGDIEVIYYENQVLREWKK